MGVAKRWIPTSSARSSSAKPLSTALIRTACSFMPADLGNARIARRFWRASAFMFMETESSRSYVTQSTVKPRDLSNIFRDELGTIEEDQLLIGYTLRKRLQTV